jgi:deoxyhypusine synthase
VPVYIPAFTDSELGLDFALYNRRRKIRGQSALRFDPFYDLEHYAQTIEKQKKIGIFTIGGGVPRNWAQQVACYIDLVNFRVPGDRTSASSQEEEKSPKRFQYGLRICPEPMQWGGLSGCTYSEGVSWGKFMSSQEGGQFVEVPSDATMVWPLILKALFERMDAQEI